MHPDDPNTALDDGRCPDDEPMNPLAFLGMCAAVAAPILTGCAIALLWLTH